MAGLVLRVNRRLGAAAGLILLRLRREGEAQGLGRGAINKPFRDRFERVAESFIGGDADRATGFGGRLQGDMGGLGRDLDPALIGDLAATMGDQK